MGEMRFWHQFTEHLGGAAGIDEIVHHQPAAAIANNRGRLDDCGLVRLLRIVIVGSVADHTHGSISLMSSARATIAAGANPPRVTATIPFHGPSSRRRQARALASRCKFFPAHGNFRGIGGGGHGHFSRVARRRCRSKSWPWRSFAQPCSPPGGASTSSVSCGRSHCSASAGDRRATGHAGSGDGLLRPSMISYALIRCGGPLSP